MPRETGVANSESVGFAVQSIVARVCTVPVLISAGDSEYWQLYTYSTCVIQLVLYLIKRVS